MGPVVSKLPVLTFLFFFDNSVSALAMSYFPLIILEDRENLPRPSDILYVVDTALHDT